MLFRSRNADYITPKRLASATNSSEKIATKYLDSLVVNNELEISSNETELIYKKTGLLEKLYK